MFKSVSTLTSACFALALTAALAVPASAGMAVRPSPSGPDKAATPGSAWKPMPKAAKMMQKGCGTHTHLCQTANKVEARTRTDSDGNFQQQSRGRMYMRINPAKGHTIEVNESGPGTFTVYQNSDFYVDGRGLWHVSFAEDVQELHTYHVAAHLPERWAPRRLQRVQRDSPARRRLDDLHPQTSSLR